MAQTSDKRKTHAFDDEQGAGGYRRLAVSCSEPGCPYRPALLTSPEKGEGLCEYHALSDHRIAAKVTAILRDTKSRRLVKAIDNLARKSYLSTLVTNPLICEVQRAGLEFGMSEETLKMRQLLGWVNGVKDYFLEPAQVYAYRISCAHRNAVLERASETGAYASDRARSAAWAEKALAAIAGRGKQIMDPTSFEREEA